MILISAMKHVGQFPWLLAIILALSFFPVTVAPDARSDVYGDLMVFHAGSLSIPFKEVAEAFNKEYPLVRVRREAAGSRACARKISDLDRDCDIFGSADYTVIDALLIPNHAQWSIRFAGNEMVIAYTEHSRRADIIDSDNWYQILLEENVAFGRSDPNSDPCGYRTVLCARLASLHYKDSRLADRLLQKDRRHIRPKETDLLALLEVGEIDYVFIYRSVAQQHGLKWVKLPDEINLNNPELATTYSKATVEISGPTPGSTITKEGAPMVYGVTIPTNAPNPKAALAFLTFLLEDKKGMAIMERNGQPALVPTFSDTYDAIPNPLKRFVTKP